MGVVYATVWMRTVSYLQCLLVIFRILIFSKFGIFSIVKGWDLGFCSWLNLRAGKDNEKVIITFDFWSVSHAKKREIFREWSVLFYFKLSTVPWLIVLVLGNKFYTIFSYFCDWNTESFYRGFARASWKAKAKDHQLQSLQQM